MGKKLALKIIEDDDDGKNQIRCKTCNKLVAKIPQKGYVEIKCPRCSTFNVALAESSKQIIITDHKGKILYINKAVEIASGYTLSEALGKKPSALWGKQMSVGFYKKMWWTIKGKKKNIRVTIVNKKKSGKLYSVTLAISPILDTKGSVIFYIGIETSARMPLRK